MDNFEKVKEQIDLKEYIESKVTLKRSGKMWKGLCPFHSESTPSFTVYPDTNTFHCFGCQANGSIVDYVMLESGIKSPSEALEQIAVGFGIDVGTVNNDDWKNRKEKIKANRTEAGSYYKQVQNVIQYLVGRGIKQSTVTNFGLGYKQESHSLSIPYLNAHGEVVGFAFRKLDYEGGNKYINSHNSETFDKSELLYGLDKARKDMKEKVYIVEGYFDVMSLHQMGYPQSVGYCSSTITDGQALLLSKYITEKTKLYLIPDNDRTGKESVRRNIDRLRLHIRDNAIRIITLPDNCKDVNDYLLLGKSLDDLGSETHEMYLLKYELGQSADIEDEYEIARQYSQKTRNKMIRSEMANYLAERWGKPLELVNSHMNTEGSVKNYAAEMHTFSQSFKAYQQYAKMGDEGKVFFGLTQLDNVVRGMRPGEVCTLLGRSGSGKTTFLLNLLHNAIFKQNHRVIFNSLELNRVNIVPQILQIIKEYTDSKVDKVYRDGMEDETDIHNFQQLDKHLVIVDKDSQSLPDIEMYARTANNEFFEQPVSLILIDYFQSLKMEGKRSGYEEKSDAARELKALAKRLNCVIVDLSQSNREDGGSGQKKLSMKGARDTGAIEEASDYVLGIYRPASDPEMSETDRLLYANDMFCQILKNRWGRTGEVKLHFEPMVKKIGDAKD